MNEEFTKRARKAFQKFIGSNSGTISVEDIEAVVISLGIIMMD